MRKGIGECRAITLTAGVDAVQEGGDVVFTLTLDKAPVEATTLNYSTATGTASSADFVSAAGQVTFAVGQTVAFVTIKTVNDANVESPESFTLNVSGSNLTAPVTVTATINDQADIDAAAAAAAAEAAAAAAAQAAAEAAALAAAEALAARTFTLTAAADAVQEGGDVVFTLTLDKAPVEATTLNYNTATGTASSADFVSAAGQVTFAVGQTVAFVTIKTVNDANVESPESFTLNVSGSNLTAPVTVTATINDQADIDAAAAAAAAAEALASKTFELTTGVNSGAAFMGGAGNNTFNAALGLDTNGLRNVQTLQGPDVIDGGAGDNILVAELDDTGTSQNPTIRNIQKYFLTANVVDGRGNADLDLSRASGYEQLWNVNSRDDIDLNNVGQTAVIGLDGVRGDTTYTVNYDASNAAVAAQTVVAINVGSEATGRAELAINTGNGADVETLNLQVSNGVYLQLEGDLDNTITALNISGSGVLDITDWRGTNTGFANLETFDSTGYADDLTFDFRGTDLTSVKTGAGDDTIHIRDAAFDGQLSVDLGAGANTLSVESYGSFGAGEVNALDFTGGVAQVQTLVLNGDVNLSDGATLDLDGVSTDLVSVKIDGDVNAGGNTFGVTNAPGDALSLDIAGSLDWAQLDTGNLTDLTVKTGAELDVDSLNGTALQNLTLNGGGQVWFDLDSNTDAVGTLQTLTIDGKADAKADLVDNGASTNLDALDALTTVTVATVGDAELNMTGVGGVNAYAGRAQQQVFNVDVTRVGGGNYNAKGTAVFTQGALPVKTYNSTYDTTTSFATQLAQDAQAVADIAAGLNAVSEFTMTADGETNPSGLFSELNGERLKVTWNDLAAHDFLNMDLTASVGTVAGENEISRVTAIAAQDAVAGTGFAGLETVSVVAGGNADVALTDVYAAFDLAVLSGGDVNVSLANTNATSATVFAEGEANLTVKDAGTGGTTYGDVLVGYDYGNPDLVSINVTGGSANVDVSGGVAALTKMNVTADTTAVVMLADDVSALPELTVTAATATVTFSDGGNFAVLTDLNLTAANATVNFDGTFDSLTTLDFTNVTTRLDVTNSGADYVLATGGNYLTYLLGSTDDGTSATDVTFGADNQREVFDFVGSDIGEVVISGFNAGADPVVSDRIDLSSFGFTNAGQLVFTVQSASGYDNLIITDLAGGAGDFSGSITLMGVIGGGVDATDIGNLNIIYA